MLPYSQKKCIKVESYFNLAPTELSDENESNQFMFVQFDDHFSLEIEKRRWKRKPEILLNISAMMKKKIVFILV